MPLFQVDIPRERLLYTSIKRFANFPFFSPSPHCLFLLLLRFSYPRFVSFPFSLSAALIRLYLILTRIFFLFVSSSSFLSTVYTLDLCCLSFYSPSFSFPSLSFHPTVHPPVLPCSLRGHLIIIFRTVSRASRRSAGR